MKKQNKTTVYVLLVVMTGIWGGIFYKFFSTVEDPKDNRPIVTISKEDANLAPERDTFTLRLDFEDPFNITKSNYSKSTVSSPSIVRTSVKRNIKKVKQTKASNWPELKYGGRVKSSNEKEIGLLMINNKEYIVNKGGIFVSLSVMGLNEDEIRLKYLNETRVIKK